MERPGSACVIPVQVARSGMERDAVVAVEDAVAACRRLPRLSDDAQEGKRREQVACCSGAQERQHRLRRSLRVQQATALARASHPYEPALRSPLVDLPAERCGCNHRRVYRHRVNVHGLIMTHSRNPSVHSGRPFCRQPPLGCAPRLICLRGTSCTGFTSGGTACCYTSGAPADGACGCPSTSAKMVVAADR